jgi:hypothetical protein
LGQEFAKSAVPDAVSWFLIRFEGPHIAFNFSTYNQQIIYIFSSTASLPKAYVPHHEALIRNPQ